MKAMGMDSYMAMGKGAKGKKKAAPKMNKKKMAMMKKMGKKK
jgi:hypothetical protein